EDRDEGVRQQAVTMLRDIALEAFEDLAEPESLEAVEEIGDPRTLAQIAKSATREIVALRALSRLDDAHMIGSVARHAALEPVRVHAVESVRARGDHAEMLAIAMNSDFKDSAVAAVDTISDRQELDQIIARSKNKSAVKRARSVVREAEERLAREAEAAAAEATAALIAATPAVVEPEAETATPPHGDPLAAELESEATRAAHEAARQREAEEAAERQRRQAEADTEAQAATARESERRHVRLAELLPIAEEAVADADLTSARKRFGVVAREWRDLTAGLDVNPDLLARYQELEAQQTARDTSAREADAKNRREALGRLQHLITRVDPLPTRPDLSLKAAERALRDVRAALAAI